MLDLDPKRAKRARTSAAEPNDRSTRSSSKREKPKKRGKARSAAGAGSRSKHAWREWSDEDVAKLLELHEELGNQHTAISKRIGRTPGSVEQKFRVSTVRVEPPTSFS